MLYINDPNAWKCAFCGSDCDESDHRFDNISSLKLLFNGLFDDGDGDKFSIIFRNRVGHHFNESDQHVCSDCLIENEEKKYAQDQPYFLEPKIFTYDFINQHHDDAKFKGFVQKNLLTSNGDLFHDIIHSLGQNMMNQRKKLDTVMRQMEKTTSEINEHAKFIYKGSELHTTTGLKDKDFEEIVSYVKPHKKFFRFLMVEEVVTVFFAHMR